MRDIRSLDAWLREPIPSTSFASRFLRDRKGRGETGRQAASRLGLSARETWLVEWSLAGKALRARAGDGMASGPVEPRWRNLTRGTVLLLLMVGNAFSVVGFCARWTRLRSVTEKVALALLLWTAAFFLMRGWSATGPDGEYEGVEAFLFMRMNNALAFGILAALVMGWFANVAVSARTVAAGMLAAAACLTAYGASVVPLYLVNRDASHQRQRMAAIHADFRRETNWLRERAKADPKFDGEDGRRTAALRMLQQTEMPVANWMKDKRAYVLHRSIVSACLDAVERGETEPESCVPKEIADAKAIDRMGTFSYLFRSQF